jgi:type VI secretion system protein ImpA
MLNLEELLAPVEGDLPAGPEARSSNEYAQVESAYRAADDPVVLSPGADVDAPGADFEDVIEPAREFLKNQSKDLSVATYLASSLLHVEGFSGFADGVELVQGLLERYWDGLHPGVEGRAAVLEWFGSDDVAYAISLVPLTDIGPNLRLPEYKAWLKEEAEGESGGGWASDDEEEGEDFSSAFGQTSREWYVELVTSLNRCSGAVESIVELGKEKFQEVDVQAPPMKPLREALAQVSKAAEDLLARKPGPPIPAETEVEEEADAAGTGAKGTEGASPGEVGGRGTLAQPTTPEDAANLILLGARFLRRERPGDPGPYLLVRGFRWGELRAQGDHLDPRILQAPSTQQRTRLKTLFLDQEFERLLDEAEEIMATPVGRGWLDLQRYTAVCAERLGPGYGEVRDAVVRATSRVLTDVPGLLEMSLMDDSATASRDTLAWMESEGVLPSEGSEAKGPEPPPRKDARKIIQSADYDRAAAMARSGDPEGAVNLLIERAEHESSRRDRFITKAEAAKIMVEHDMGPVARPILDELYQLIEEHRLEEWEPAEVVARPLSLLYRCLNETEDQFKEEIYPRLAKLSPLLAMQVSGRGSRKTNPEPSTPEPPPSEDDEAPIQSSFRPRSSTDEGEP